MADPVGTAGTKQKTGSPVRVSVSFDAADYADQELEGQTGFRRLSAVSSYLDTRAPLFAASAQRTRD